MKVLLISFDFFPDNSPNTYRWFNITKEWEKKGVEIFVISARKAVPGFPKFEKYNQIKVYRTGGSLLDILKEKFSSSITNSTSDDLVVSNKSKNNFVKIIHDLTWKKIYFPDFAVLWQKPAFRVANELIKKENINNLITVSWPISGHAIGAKLAKNHKINWIADTIDPFFLSNAVNNVFLYKKLNYKYESKILKDVNAVSVLTDKLKTEYLRLFPYLKDKLVVIPNVFVPYALPEKKVLSDNKAFKLVFVGSLSPITRSPENLLRLFNEIVKSGKVSKDIELHFYGHLQSCNTIFDQYKHLLNRNLFLHSFQPREKIVAILVEADVVVNIGNNNRFQEPSKLIEYIYLGKRILNICSIQEDTAKEMLEGYISHLNIFPEDIVLNEKFVLKESIFV
jgi:glycosyltransferase involved in cell wall biosynthesis